MPPNETLPLWSLVSGEQGRDEGMERVLKKAGIKFTEQACEVVRHKLTGAECLAEEFRRVCIEEGVEPHDPHAWGALTNNLARAGVIEKTGRIEKSKDPRSHARLQPVWRVKA
jgi:hypothetical protein